MWTFSLSCRQLPVLIRDAYFCGKDRFLDYMDVRVCCAGGVGYAVPGWTARFCVANGKYCSKTPTRRCLSCEEYHCYDSAILCDECFIEQHVRVPL